MHSLALKLTLAFLIVGALGAILVAVFLGLQTRSQFNQFLSDSSETAVVANLADYYATNGSWRGANHVLMQLSRQEGQRPGARALPWVLADETGQVILGNGRYNAGQQLTTRILNASEPIIVEGARVGYLVQVPIQSVAARQSPETNFLVGVTRAIWLSSALAIGAALLIGLALARNIAQPVRQLTEATTAVAHGELGRQVDVRSDDEIGDLAIAFNQMSRDLALASRQRRQMTADIAHELRTPLSIILGYTESLRDGVLPPDADTISIIHDEALHLSHLVQDLRTLSLADAGELALAWERIAPAELLHNAAARFTLQAEQKPITLRVVAPPDLPDMTVDARRMEQVLRNLLSNAFRFTPAHGAITLSAAQIAPDTIRLSVQDTGAGIPADALPHVFDRFYKADASRAADDGESGLGLAIARSLVRMHGGVIQVESPVGAGATFMIDLPLAGGGQML
jgi:two-component system, OmpR family, sensor histidine kinase BaeS